MPITLGRSICFSGLAAQHFQRIFFPAAMLEIRLQIVRQEAIPASELASEEFVSGYPVLEGSFADANHFYCLGPAVSGARR